MCSTGNWYKYHQQQAPPPHQTSPPDLPTRPPHPFTSTARQALCSFIHLCWSSTCVYTCLEAASSFVLPLSPHSPHPIIHSFMLMSTYGTLLTPSSCTFLKARRTIRFISDEKFDRSILDKCIEAAATAPSGAHCQPWHFAVVESAGVTTPPSNRFVFR